MKPSPTAVIVRAAAISAVGLVVLLTAGDATAQSRNGGFQNSFRSQALGRIGNQPFAIQRANRGTRLRNQILSNPNRLSANRDRRDTLRPVAPLPQTPPANNAGNGNGGGNQTVFFAPLPQTPPSNNNAGNRGGNRGGNGGGFQRINPLPQAPGQSGSGQRAGSSNPQFIVLPNTPPANRPVRQQTAALQPAATDLIATAAPRQAAAESVKAPEETPPAPVKVRGLVKHFVVKLEQRYYHVAKTAGDEYLLMGYVDSDFRYHKWQR